MKIIWDSKKAAANPVNHDGVTFEEAQNVLLDPYALTREDSDSEKEQRFITLGMGGKQRILVVVYTYREETIRLLSAWKAKGKERCQGYTLTKPPIEVLLDETQVAKGE